jgi:hypothetical protein
MRRNYQMNKLVLKYIELHLTPEEFVIMLDKLIVPNSVIKKMMEINKRLHYVNASDQTK